MKNRIASIVSKTLCLMALIVSIFWPCASPAQTSISININYNTYPGESSYYIQMPITATTNPITYDEVISPHTNFFTSLDSNGIGFFATYATITQFTDLANAITNGNWLYITDAGTPTQKTYSFHVTFTNFNSNDMPGVQVTYPMPQEAITTTNVTYTWSGGPTFYNGLGLTIHNTDYSFYEGVGIDPAYYSSWNFETLSEPSVEVVGGDTNFYFDINYETSGTNYMGISTPLTTNGQPVPGGWSATSTLNLSENNNTNTDGDGVHFTLMTNMSSGSGTGHTNLVYYSFADDSIFAYDFSGNGNSIVSVTWDLAEPYMTNDAVPGSSYAVGFAGAANGGGWLNMPTNLVATLAGSFSAALWIRTSQNRGNNTDTADTGSGLMAANSDQVIPMALTGSKLAFLTGGGSPDTLHSATSVNTGNYVCLVVTRDQATGTKNIYVNGNLDASDTGPLDTLNTASTPTLRLGCDASIVNGFAGDMDGVQIYSGVLSAADVTYLFHHQGAVVPDTAGQDPSAAFNAALGDINMLWGTTGDASWFVETTNTYSPNAAAVQSGSVTNTQVSILSTTVSGPGTLTFYWSSIANDPNQGFDCEFYVDTTNNDMGDLYSGYNAWSQAQFTILPGQHTVGWAVFPYGDTDPTEAAFLDQVLFVPVPPVTLLSPKIAGASFQFQFLSEAGFTHYVLYRTNLATGAWLTYTTIAGDGTVKTNSIPLSVFSPSKAAFVRVATE